MRRITVAIAASTFLFVSIASAQQATSTKVYPEMAVYDKDGQPYSVKYQLLAPMLLNELQKRYRKVEMQAQTIEELTQTEADTPFGYPSQNRHQACSVTEYVVELSLHRQAHRIAPAEAKRRDALVHVPTDHLVK